ncbi:MAG: hypothetical protein GEU75_17645 [Dehalococcoidia bacterium]|nr:hypothetical protein [Dehalococcoidia bacterium]
MAERLERVSHQPTNAELAAVTKWEARQARRSVDSWEGWSTFGRPTIPEWDHLPTGMLRITINEGVYGYNGVRKSFGDGKTQRVEDLMNDLFEALATWSAAIKAERHEQELWQREWKEKERRREEHQRREALESKRAEALTRDLKRWRKGQGILQLVAEVEEKLAASDASELEEATQWIEWAKSYAARLDPIREDLPRLLTFDDFEPWELT